MVIANKADTDTDNEIDELRKDIVGSDVTTQTKQVAKQTLERDEDMIDID